MKTISRPLTTALFLMGLILTFHSGMTSAQGVTPLSQTVVDNSLHGQNPGGMIGETDPVPLGEWINGDFCDDFNVANTTTIADWTEQSGDWQIVDSRLQTPGNLDWEYITVDGSTQADGYLTARAIYGSPDVVKFVGLVGRYASSSTYLMAKIQDNSSSGYWDYLFINNNGSNIGSWSGNYGTDAIIEMEYIGSDITVRIDVDRDGTPDYIYEATVTNTSPGLFGLGAYQNAFIDDFCSGDQTPKPVPLSNIALLMSLILGIGFIILKVYRKI